MSIKDRLTKKTGDLLTPSVSPVSPVVGTQVEVKAPKTGPGQMLAFRSHMDQNEKQLNELQSKLKEFEGSTVVRLLDPKVVHASKWVNRHETSFTNESFIALKDEIETAGLNVQPIRVRHLEGVSDKFEIVFGHRRHQACLQLGLSVAAIVEDIGDKDLFEAMDRENRTRADLSPYEQGEMYRRALDEGLYASLRQLANELSVDVGNASKAISIARLPSQVLAAFESPTQIQYRWGQKLVAALQKDPDAVLARAKAIQGNEKEITPEKVLDMLLGIAKDNKPETKAFTKKGRAVGTISRKEDGSIKLSLKPGVLSDHAYEKFLASVETLIK
jgi:ParB family chromosome partitioning protein